MLISISGEFAKTVTGFSFCRAPFFDGERGGEHYEVYVHTCEGERLCGTYATKEGAVKAIKEAAEKLNAAQGEPPAPKEKVTMKHMEYDGDDNNMYFCTRCNMWMQAYRWYKYCPNCGGEIKGWD